MITKPVSRIFKVTGIYDVNNASKTLSSLTFSVSDAGKLIVVNKATGYVVNFHGTPNLNFQNLDVKTLGEVDIYYITDDAKKPLMKFPGSKSFRYSDIFNINIKNANSGVDFYGKIYGYTYCCGGEYGIRFEVQNDELFMQQYPNKYFETYMVGADECCKQCDGTTKAVDDSEITKQLYQKIAMARKEGASMLIPHMIVNGEYVLYDSTQASSKYFLQLDGTYGSSQPTESKALAKALGLSSDGVLSADTDLENVELDEDKIDAIMTWNSKLTTGGSPVETALVVSVSPSDKYTYGMYNLKYVKNRATVINMAPVSNMVCSGEFMTNSDEGYTSGDITVGATAIGAYAIEETSGYDLNRVEFEEMGWMGESPYRFSQVTWTEFGHKYSFDDSALYDLMTISYEQQSDAAWGHFNHPLEVALAVVSTDTNNVFRDLERLFAVVAYNGNKESSNKNINLK
jgi:hypothetical protein